MNDLTIMVDAVLFFHRAKIKFVLTYFKQLKS